MGMAASQARLIELTARKSNVEYEGQQINQQRVNLANESAGMFNQLMALQVPTPPSSNDFTKTVYSFSDGTSNYTIDTVTDTSESAQYNAKVRYYTDVTKYTGLYKEKNDLEISKRTSGSDVVYYYGTTKLADYNKLEDDSALTQISVDQPNTLVAKNFTKTSNVQTGTNPDGTTYRKISATDSSGYYTTETYYSDGKIKSIETYHDANNNTKISYDTAGVPSYSGTIGGVPLDPADPDIAKKMLPSVEVDYPERDKIKSYKAGGQTYYISIDQYSGGATIQPVVSCYACDFTSKEYRTSNAYIAKEASGRYSSITLEGFSNPMDLTVKQETDQNAYNDAMNEYTYKQTVYEKQVQDINAKTEKIQEEDRTLEMKLKQLDTEHNALQTEMDAVKKVIDKNVEGTFKTFS